MRPIWKGSISFGLVNIPVGLYPATRSSRQVQFRMLRDSDKSPVHYKRVAEADEREVPWEHIVKGYEYEKGKFVVMEPGDFERVAIKSTQTVDIKEFVSLDDIDPMFFDEPYFLAPEKGGDKAYALLREVLKKSNKVGIAKVVIKTREHLAAVKPMGNALVLELMHFADELADPNQLNLPESEVGKKELSMAESLVGSMTDRWNPERYEDEYRENLMHVLEEKVAAGGKSLPAGKKVKLQATNVVDLVAVLQKSLEQTHAQRGAGKKMRSKKARHKEAA